MLITLESDAPELSFLLHKHPDKVHSQDTSFGQVHVFYPVPTKAALLLEIDPLRLTRRGGSPTFALQPYVNDRPYVASSFLSVALNAVLRTAMAGRCNRRPELVEDEMFLKVHIPALPSRGGEKLLRDLFEPLGYTVSAERLPLDTRFPKWGPSSVFDVTLTIKTQLYWVLRHLYVLIPVLDNDKHYWVGPEEVEKLLERGSQWLADHPERDLIVSRYLKFRRDLTGAALDSLTVADPEEPENTDEGVVEDALEAQVGLHDRRLQSVAALLSESGYHSIADLGCGEGKLLPLLAEISSVRRVIGMDVSVKALERAEVQLQRMKPSRREKIELQQGSLLYDDSRLHGVEAAVMVEVIEHLEPDRLGRAAYTLLHRIRPELLVITTPNREYNVLWPSLPAGRFRHSDHRFEWTREEFRQWCESHRGDYSLEILGLGDEHPDFGAPSQMAVFRR